jgi:hypothetical protein
MHLRQKENWHECHKEIRERYLFEVGQGHSAPFYQQEGEQAKNQPT